MVDELDEITAHSDGKPVLVIMADGREILPDPLPTPGTGTGNFSRDPTWPSIAERPVFRPKFRPLTRRPKDGGPLA